MRRGGNMLKHCWRAMNCSSWIDRSESEDLFRALNIDRIAVGRCPASAASERDSLSVAQHSVRNDRRPAAVGEYTFELKSENRDVRLSPNKVRQFASRRSAGDRQLDRSRLRPFPDRRRG